MKITNGTLTKYVYGRGLIGEETNGEFKTYHFDSRGSTVAITDETGAITDTFAYDTYGKLIARTGTSDVIFQYNGLDGVITEPNGLIYMRARYYSTELRRFINADIVAGTITDSTSLNRYAYVNGNPVSFVDPFGLSANLAQFSTKAMTDGGSGKDKRGNSYSTTSYIELSNKNIEYQSFDLDNEAEVIGAKSWFIEKIINVVNEVTENHKQIFRCVINTAKKIHKFGKDIPNIVIDNISASAGICIGMGFACDYKGIGIEAITRMDIIGVQLNDSNFRIGHPGKSGLNVTLPVDPAIDVTLGPQNNTYEDFGLEHREVEDTIYLDVGKSYGAAAAFVIGYHYDVSISYSGIIKDIVEYFKE